MERYFKEYLRPVLSPQVVDAHHPFPHLPTKVLTIAVTLQRENGETSFGVIPVPKALPACYQLEEHGLRYILTEQIILCLLYTSRCV